MASISDQLRDVFTARAFDLEKVKTASAVGISKILEDLMREIDRELRDADPTGVKRTAYQQERVRLRLHGGAWLGADVTIFGYNKAHRSA